MFITQNAIADAVLFKLFEHAQASDKRLKASDVADRFSIGISPKRVAMALDDLYARDLISKWHGDHSYSIESKGYYFVEKEFLKSESFFRKYLDFGDDWLSSQTLNNNDIPAADRIVNRSDNQLRLEEFSKNIDIIEGELKKDNEIGDVLGDERDVFVSEFEAAKVLTKGSSFRISRLFALIVPALRFLSDKFSGAAIGEAAKRLMQLLFELV